MSDRHPRRGPGADGALPRAAAGPAVPGGLLGRLGRPEAAFALALAVLSLRTLALVARDKHYLILDDAFISFRYARNLVRGLGLVFNPGERVEGYTNFLWTVLLAAAERLGLDMVTASVVLAFLATAGTLLVLLLIGLRVFAAAGTARAWLAALPPLLFAAGGAQARYVVSGMETSLFVFLVVLAIHLLLRGTRPWLAGLAFALAAMTRPEGILYLGVALLCHLLWGEAEGEGWRGRLASGAWILGGFLVLYLPYFLWRWQYYGDLLPNTFYVKTGTGSRGPLIRRGFLHLLQSGRQAGLELPLLIALLGLPAVRRERALRLFWLAVAATAAYVVLVGGDFLFFFGPRFLNPALPLALLLAAAGVGALLRWAGGRRALASVLAGGSLLLLLANAAWFSWPARSAEIAYLPVINEGWTEMGKWIARHTPEAAVVAVGAAGRIPFYSDRPTIDMLGLTDVHIAHLPMELGTGIPGHEKYDTGYVLERRPDYIVFPRLDPQGRPFLVNWSEYGEAVEAEYELVALARMVDSPAPWIQEASAWTPELGRQGYAAAVYRRRALAADGGGAHPGEG